LFPKIYSNTTSSSVGFAVTGNEFEEARYTLEKAIELKLQSREYPAASEIASRILEANGVSAKYGKGKSVGNYIQDVVNTTGPGTDFMGQSQKLWSDLLETNVENQAYWDAVWNYLRTATGQELPNPPVGYPVI
jgi:glycerol-3-phosphate dehydrogenase